MFHVVDGMTEKAFTQALELLDRIGGKETQAGGFPALFSFGSRRRKSLQVRGNRPRSRLGGIHNAHVRRRNPP